MRYVQASRSPGVAPLGRVNVGHGAGGRAGALLALQRSAGNSAVASRIVQRDVLEDVGLGAVGGGKQAGGDGHDLESDLLRGEPKLERIFDNKDRLRQGDSGEPVVRVQKALKIAESKTGNTYDLGASGPLGDGVDGAYGGKTAAAVKKFKGDENLGFTQFGDVGPGTIGRLDQMTKGGGPVPPEEEEGIVHPTEGVSDGPEPAEPNPPHPDDGIGGGRKRPPFFPPPFFSFGGSESGGFDGGESPISRLAVSRDQVRAQDRSGELHGKRVCTGGGLTTLFSKLMQAIDSAVGLASRAAAGVFHGAVTGIGALFGPIGALIGGIVGYFTSDRVKDWVKNKLNTVLAPAKAELFKAIQKINGVLFGALQPVFDFEDKWAKWFAFLKPYVSWASDMATWIRNTLARFKFKNELLNDVAGTLEDIKKHGDAPVSAMLGCKKT